ncbi:cystathionine gamma-synthase [Neptunicella marina]|uniref:Cystathionine gamma-synthase n=1 Tax=Neptunicella marina TaxID=2125989 RepID=A0A8J6IR59_9ALTE|nr:cystathionine gamma-synthase [Neptunicella marina]MBC3766030.1 cystathionine gamma-synthase [Neptunicella marina]
MAKLHSQTLAVRSGIETDPVYGAVVPPIYTSSNFAFSDFREPGQFDYARSGNPGTKLLENTLAELEQGAGAIVTNCGLAGITLLMQLLEQGDTLVVPHDAYGGSLRLFKALAQKGHFNLEVVDQTDEQQLKQALASKPKMIWLETPSNPLLRIVDIQLVCDIAKQQGTLVAVDNTFLSPILQKPLNLGADFVLHSCTKYINGHSDALGGVVVCADAQQAEDLGWWANCLGLTDCSALNNYMVLRGVRTLSARMAVHQQNARQLVDALRAHPQVTKLYYPGLEEHPGHEIAKKQQAGFGGMFSFELKGDLNQVQALLSRLELFSIAESLGGTESLICCPSTMTHRSMDAESQQKAGIAPTLLRVSAGIEHGDDLVADLINALNSLEA